MFTFSVVLYAKELTPLEYFNNLIEKRTEFIRLYSEYKQAFFYHAREEDGELAEKYGKKIDRIEKRIDELKEQHGFEDPSDFPHSEGSNN
jgi:uncharacterized protein Yka (UPF0111/DUF47 family)